MEKHSISPTLNAVLELTITTCNNDESYEQYSSREKMLAFIYTLIQQLNEQETHYISIIQNDKWNFLKPIRSELISYYDDILFAATNTGEIQARPFLANYYAQVLLTATHSILFYWSTDTSASKEKTDVIVEKTVHFAFDLLAPNALDSGFDLVQHLFKIRN